MMEPVLLCDALFAFLLTYLMYSTVTLGMTAMLTYHLKAVSHPELRVLIWQSALSLPLLMTVVVTALDLPHYGLQLPIATGGPTAGFSQATRMVNPLESGLGGAIQPGDSGGLQHSNFPGISTAERERFAGSSGASSAYSAWWPEAFRVSFVTIALLVWLVAVVIGFLRLGVQLLRLKQLRRIALPVLDAELQATVNCLGQQLGIRSAVAVVHSPDVQGPMTAGIFAPFIMLPDDLCCENSAFNTEQGHSAASELSALLAHELVHIARRDALRNLMIQVLSCTFPFQPLNWLAGRQLRKTMDFVADSRAALVLGERTGLARCLLRLGDRLANGGSNATPDSPLAASMASFASTLGQRIEVLLNKECEFRPFSRSARAAIIVLLTVAALFATSIAPRAIAQTSKTSPDSEMPSIARNNSMHRPLSTLAILIGLAMPAVADEPQQKPATPAKAPTELKATPDPLPKGLERFNGMLVGRLAAKDVEKGTFVVQVDAVPRVWQNSKAEDPKSIVGTSVKVTGVFGKFLDVLVVTRIGETVEFECKHDGDQLVFPGELLRKVAPYDPADYPVLPEAFRGFRGTIAGEVLKKDPETFELIVKVQRIQEIGKENAAKQPTSIEGKAMMLAGFWNRKDAYHNLKAGDRIEVGVQHIGLRSDHLTVAEFVRKGGQTSVDGMMKKEGASQTAEGLKKELSGFRGMLVGRLVEKDVERGTFTVTVDAVPRVWNNNKSDSPKKLLGKNVAAEGVTGKMLDALVVAKVGETLEFGALHDGGERVRVGEVLRKVQPVKPGDYPVLSDDFRGFRGLVVAKVIRKDEHLMDLVVEIREIKQPFDNNRAPRAESMIGKQAMLSGFWNRKDAFHSIRVGDTIECGLEHPQYLSDHLSVIESVKKIEKK